MCVSIGTACVTTCTVVHFIIIIFKDQLNRTTGVFDQFQVVRNGEKSNFRSAKEVRERGGGGGGGGGGGVTILLPAAVNFFFLL